MVAILSSLAFNIFSILCSLAAKCCNIRVSVPDVAGFSELSSAVALCGCDRREDFLRR